MLKLVDIKKDYPVADTTVHALRGVSLEFRSNEFVAILGPSGCGKTTLLNIIGGLDHYTSGDLIIAGKSTKSYKDRDWDSYRNHRIGFIFQSYNLIPHQTILGNVELALTISGMSSAERKEKAKKALERVGLGEELNKKPNQLSGGQMQRVAIARALVNDPEILLADEPTGALDTKTSIQIMELIKEIAHDRLVIMVTHNPELAEKYASRIVRLRDGKVVKDTNPYKGDKPEYGPGADRLRAKGYSEEQIQRYYAKKARKKEEESKAGAKKKRGTDKEGRTYMSFGTTLALSANNLWSKKGRTSVTAIAGSIGIIGVCLVLALSAGIKGYIADMEDDMLSGNPVTVSETAYDLDSLSDTLSSSQKQEIVKNAEEGRVYIDSYIQTLATSLFITDSLIVSNEITEEYVDYVASMPEEYYGAMTLDYGVDLTHSIYTGLTYTDTDGSSTTDVMSVKAIQSVYTELLEEHSDYADMSSYIALYSDIFAQAPNNAEYIENQYDIMAGKVATEKDEIMIVLNSNGEATDLLLAQLGYITQDQFMDYAFSSMGYETSGDLVESVSYDDILDKEFTWYANDSIYTLNTADASNGCTYMYTPYADDIEDTTDSLSLKVVGILQPKETLSYGCLSSGIYYTEALAEYIVETNSESEIIDYYTNGYGALIYEYMGAIYSGADTSGTVITGSIGYTFTYVFDGVTYDSGLCFAGLSSSTTVLASLMGVSSGVNYSSFSLRDLGGETVPNDLSIYPVDFDSKDLVTDYLDDWNDEGSLTYYSVSQGKNVTLSESERDEVTYTDTLSLVITMINTMIDIVTYGLVAFTSISLVVSCVMIGVITYVSVVERTKEIGVLRALGARKHDVSNLFNAETFIIGLLAGVFGVLVSYLISIPVNMIFYSLVGVTNIMRLPIWQALIMIAVSFVLTMISGLFPARAAAKKDPVIALRTE